MNISINRVENGYTVTIYQVSEDKLAAQATTYVASDADEVLSLIELELTGTDTEE